MTQKEIGLSFANEIQAAGLSGLAFSWDQEGNIFFDPSLTDVQVQAIEAVYAAHDPSTPLLSRSDALDQLWAEKIALPVTVQALNLITLFSPEWQATINGAYQDALADPTKTFYWEAIDGWHALSSADVITVWKAGASYIQACFATKYNHANGTDDITTGWPSTTI